MRSCSGTPGVPRISKCIFTSRHDRQAEGGRPKTRVGQRLRGHPKPGLCYTVLRGSPSTALTMLRPETDFPSLPTQSRVQSSQMPATLSPLAVMLVLPSQKQAISKIPLMAPAPPCCAQAQLHTDSAQGLCSANSGANVSSLLFLT